MKRLRGIFLGTGARKFVTAYALFTLTGAILLMTPMSLQPGKTISFTDALFIAVSGISTTGLSTISVSETFTRFGQVVLVFILQSGGLGLIMLMGLFWIMSGKKLGVRELSMIKQDQNQIGFKGISKLIKDSIKILIFIEALMISIMSVYLYLRGYFNWQDSVFQAFFMTVSMITNAGFDISPEGASLSMYNQDYFFMIMAMFLMFTGAVGFWPLVDIKDWVKSKIKGEDFEFSIYSKLIIKMHIFLWIGGAAIIYILEMKQGGYFYHNSTNIIDPIFYSVFSSLTTRNAGFAVIDFNNFSEATQTLSIVLMIVGSSPNSAGGGIRTTTFVLTILALYSFAIGRKQVVYKKKAIKMETVNKALFVTIGAFLLVFASTFFLLLTNPTLHFKHAFFEVASAFGTTGLSLGITSSLNVLGKVNLIIIMFIGRIGILTTLNILQGDRDKSVVMYPEIDMIVG